MYANEAALVAPISSNTIPRSHVTKAIAVDVKTKEVVKIKCRRELNGSSGKK